MKEYKSFFKHQLFVNPIIDGGRVPRVPCDPPCFGEAFRKHTTNTHTHIHSTSFFIDSKGQFVVYL